METLSNKIKKQILPSRDKVYLKRLETLLSEFLLDLQKHYNLTDDEIVSLINSNNDYINYILLKLDWNLYSEMYL